MTIKSKTFSANTYKERIQIFRYYFLEEIEQWFTSSIACCAKCAENFWRTWPGVRGDKEIEMDLEDFFEGSCLSDIFYPKEIEHFSKYLQCPKCHETLDSYFVIFEHPFTPPNSFDRHLNEIAAIASRTPFLLLSHPFAKRTHKVIKSKGRTTLHQAVDSQYFRARERKGKSVFGSLTDFGPAPAELVAEGRFNHADHSMLYLALDENTAFKEIASPGKEYFVATLSIRGKLKILNLELRNKAESDEEILIQCLARSALCAAPRTGNGWVAREYVFTRFVADCARNAGFDGIQYGSTKDRSGVNLVLLEPPQPLSTVASLGEVRLKNLMQLRVPLDSGKGNAADNDRKG
jgi:hypothetical protein